MTITIQISQGLLHKFKDMKKLHPKESYEYIIWELLKDTFELYEQTQANIKKSEEYIKEGKIYICEEIKMNLGL
ncbi:MAG: hypothetical protein DRP06_03080 [Candidatus Aenigmatarchaeota archaeon]|nr:MAG: hypothetical protein DRP06_03080 [Candidatus Aenigmarchaeota archaeon]